MPKARDLNQGAEGFVRLLYKQMREMIHPHGREHEPGGRDPVEQPLGFHRDVSIDRNTLADGQVLKYEAATDTFVFGAGAGTPHGAFLRIDELDTLSLPATVDGPLNLSGANRTILDTNQASDGTVTATITTGTWTDNARLSVTITAATGGATYFLVDWLIA